MSHLTLLPPPPDGAWSEPTLDIPGLPPLTLSSMDSDDRVDDVYNEPLRDPDPQLEALLSRQDAMVAGLSGAEAHAVWAGMYIDGDGNLRTRHKMLRVLP